MKQNILKEFKEIIKNAGLPIPDNPKDILIQGQTLEFKNILSSVYKSIKTIDQDSKVLDELDKLKKNNQKFLEECI